MLCNRLFFMVYENFGYKTILCFIKMQAQLLYFSHCFFDSTKIAKYLRKISYQKMELFTFCLIIKLDVDWQQIRIVGVSCDDRNSQ